MKFIILLALSTSVHAAAVRRSEFFNDSAEFAKAFQTLSPKMGTESGLLAGPLLDHKTKEAFIVTVKDDKCALITEMKSKKISCKKAMKIMILRVL